MLRKLAFGFATAFALALGIGATTVPASAEGFSFSFSAGRDAPVFSIHGRDHREGRGYRHHRGHKRWHHGPRYGGEHRGRRHWKRGRHYGHGYGHDDCRRIRKITVWYDRHGRRHRDVTIRRVCGGYRY